MTHLALTMWSLGALASLQGVAAAAVESGRASATPVWERASESLRVGPDLRLDIGRRSAPRRGEAMTQRKRRTPTHDGKSSTKAVKVPGGWKLPGDDTVYPYDPLVPPDMVDPLPRPQGRRPNVGGKTAK